jgi:hypothetical protein
MRSLLIAAVLIMTLAMPVPGYAADEIRFDVAVLPEFQKYAALLSYPGYAAMALENNGLSPRIKMIVKERGRAIEAGNVIVRFEGRKGELYSFEMGIVVGVATFNTRLTFPVILDVSSLGSGKISVTMKPPFAALLPADFNARLHRRVGTIVGTSEQTTMLAYLDEITKGGSDAPQLAAMVEAILLDAYNRSGGPAAASRDALALPTADQWMLIITFMIWLFLVSALLVVYVRRQRRGKPVLHL